MGEDGVFAGVAGLVAVGEYLDQVPGRVGVDLDGGGVFAARRRLYVRGSPEFLAARDRGWIEPLPPLRPASPRAVRRFERRVGAPLPPLLRRLYLEVGDGGFGPGYGLIGLDDPERKRGAAPRMLLCHWGCGITSDLDLADGQVWGSDPNPAPPGVPYSYPQGLTITEWFARWLDGRLYQPWLVEDPVTGDWRGATDEEYAEAGD